jgi:hypothetical protein
MSRHHLDPTNLDPIVHEAAEAGTSDRPSGPNALPRIC